MEREHSNVCYIMKFDGKDENGKHIYRFEAVEKAKPFKNQYGLDIFEIKGELTEGRSGLKLCNKDQFESNMEKTTPEQMEKIINGAVEKYGLSPRYTRPEETKKDVFEKKESDGSFLAPDLYNERHRYISVYNQSGIEFFVKKSGAEEFNATLFVMANGYMIAVDQKHCMDEAVKKIESINAAGGMIAYIEGQFNQMLSDPIRWADVGYARILNREEEATLHNAPIRKMRDEARAKEDAERKARDEQRNKEEQEARDNMIAEAESNIKNHEKLMNNSIETETGTETSIVLFLMKKYGIKVPIKTQGWINSALHSVTWDNGEVGYRYFKTSKESTVFLGYLKQLVEQICKADKCA